jgi:protein-S-isoprenylcysteine O-methyltransferase Ste14
VKVPVALGLALIVLAFALGLPLLGWGIADWRGFFSSPVRLAYAAACILQSLVQGIGYALLPFSYTPGRREGQSGKRVARQSVVPVITRLIWAASMLVSGFSDRRSWLVFPDADWLRLLGVLIYLLALGWVYWSFITLGRQHSAEVTIQEDHQFITDGPYRWVRHPMYLGLIIFPAGAGMAFGSWIGMALPLLTTALFIWRIADEERLMHQEFGNCWETYSRRTWRLVPFLY